jgi:hypothetical protein
VLHKDVAYDLLDVYVSLWSALRFARGAESTTPISAAASATATGCGCA